MSTQMQLVEVAQTQLTSDDYYTPAWVFERLGLKFDVDVAAPPGGVEWIPARHHFTKADDGLAQPWSGRVWMNPPYSAPEPWVDRFIRHGNGVCLVPFSNGRWMHRLWNAADGLALPADSALKFVGGGIPIRTVLAAMGHECSIALRGFGVVRTAL